MLVFRHSRARLNSLKSDIFISLWDKYITLYKRSQHMLHIFLFPATIAVILRRHGRKKGCKNQISTAGRCLFLCCSGIVFIAVNKFVICNNLSIHIDKKGNLDYNNIKFNTSNRWSGDNGNDAFTENLWCWESGKKQVVKWTAEGAVKCDFHKVFCDVAGRRHLPGICGYPAKRTGHAVNSRWHRG